MLRMGTSPSVHLSSIFVSSAAISSALAAAAAALELASEFKTAAVDDEARGAAESSPNATLLAGAASKVEANRSTSRECRCAASCC